MPSRVVYSTQKVLDIFAEHKVKATFFTLGSVARRNPDLVKQIVAFGHELGSHGYGHRIAYLQSQKAFARDVHRTKRLLEDISGHQVSGYRAPNFSITEKNPWAYDKLIEAGYLYDSSVYPVWHPRYKNLNKPRNIFEIKRPEGSIKIVPLAAAKFNVLGYNIALGVAGGAYWRLFPSGLIKWALQRINVVDKIPFTCYLHPWELDSGQPHFSELSATVKLRQYTNLSKFESRLHYFLSNFKFCSIKELLEVNNN
jgi:polysaccharide deacetylase family protein (PEP-CTERM system associated)